jgi:hypothetical protein
MKSKEYSNNPHESLSARDSQRRVAKEAMIGTAKEEAARSRVTRAILDITPNAIVKTRVLDRSNSNETKGYVTEEQLPEFLQLQLEALRKVAALFDGETAQLAREDEQKQTGSLLKRVVNNRVVKAGTVGLGLLTAACSPASNNQQIETNIMEPGTYQYDSSVAEFIRLVISSKPIPETPLQQRINEETSARVVEADKPRLAINPSNPTHYVNPLGEFCEFALDRMDGIVAQMPKAARDIILEGASSRRIGGIVNKFGNLSRIAMGGESILDQVTRENKPATPQISVSRVGELAKAGDKLRVNIKMDDGRVVPITVDVVKGLAGYNQISLDSAQATLTWNVNGQNIVKANVVCICGNLEIETVITTEMPPATATPTLPATISPTVPATVPATVPTEASPAVPPATAPATQRPTIAPIAPPPPPQPGETIAPPPAPPAPEILPFLPPAPKQLVEGCVPGRAEVQVYEIINGLRVPTGLVRPEQRCQVTPQLVPVLQALPPQMVPIFLAANNEQRVAIINTNVTNTEQKTTYINIISNSPTVAPTAPVTPESTPTHQPRLTRTATATATGTVNTATPTATWTVTSSPTASVTPGGPTLTPSSTATATSTVNTATPTATWTPSPTPRPGTPSATPETPVPLTPTLVVLTATTRPTEVVPSPTTRPTPPPTEVVPSPTTRPTIVPQTALPSATVGRNATETPAIIATRIPTATVVLTATTRPTEVVPSPTTRPTIVPQTALPSATVGRNATETPAIIATRIPTAVFTATTAPTLARTATSRPTIAPATGH